ncbi:methyltransferase domain-containing protein [bacterium]|nr:methyltransferase domain-containing protein [bacterium]
MSQTGAMQEVTTRSIYDFYAAFYDATFGRLVRRRIGKAIAHLQITPADTVLDLGIGTGVSLDYYPKWARVVGIDISSGMLREARKKIAELGMSRTRLCRANALSLSFPDNTFDTVFISHVISVVSNPYQVMEEARRVARPGAQIVIVNHFQSTNKFIALVEKWLCPLCTKLGWRSDLGLEDLLERTGLQVDYRYKLESIDLWQTVMITNRKAPLAAHRTLTA